MKQLAGASEEFKQEGVSFLRALLQPDPARRLTAQQALEHPFLTSAFVTVDPATMPPKYEKPIKVESAFCRELREAINMHRDALKLQSKGEVEEEDDQDVFFI